MSDCNCTFAYHSVVPPTHCPKCGRCLGCGQGFSPTPYPYRYPAVPYPTPWTTPPWPWRYGGTITCATTTSDGTT